MMKLRMVITLCMGLELLLFTVDVTGIQIVKVMLVLTLLSPLRAYNIVILLYTFDCLSLQLSSRNAMSHYDYMLSVMFCLV